MFESNTNISAALSLLCLKVRVFGRARKPLNSSVSFMLSMRSRHLFKKKSILIMFLTMCKNVLPHINKSFFFNVYLKLVFCQGEVYSCMLNKLDKNKKKVNKL